MPKNKFGQEEKILWISLHRKSETFHTKLCLELARPKIVTTTNSNITQ